jgi:hypothetical protein
MVELELVKDAVVSACYEFVVVKGHDCPLRIGWFKVRDELAFPRKA